jgi:hypothetical protein
VKKLWVGVAVVAVVLGAVAGPAAAAGPAFTGGAQLSAYAGHRHSSVAGTPSGEALAVWEQKVGAQYDIWGARMTTDTTQVSPSFAIASGAKNQLNPDVAWDGQHWQVVWEEATTAANHDIKLQTLAADGDRLGAARAVVATTANQSTPTIAAGKNAQSLIAWRDARNSASTATDVYARRLQGNGQMLDGSGLRLSNDTSATKRTDAEPDAAFNGATYLVAWSSTRGTNRAIQGDQRRPDGTRVKSAQWFSSTTLPAGSPAVAAGGSRFLVVLDRGDAIVGALTKSTNVAAYDEIAISYATGSKALPAVAFNGGSYLVVWVDGRNGSQDLWGTRLNTSGLSEDGGVQDGFLVTEYHPVNTAPALAGGGQVQKWTITWDATPAGQSSGVVAYGMHTLFG